MDVAVDRALHVAVVAPQRRAPLLLREPHREELRESGRRLDRRGDADHDARMRAKLEDLLMRVDVNCKLNAEDPNAMKL